MSGVPASMEPDTGRPLSRGPTMGGRAASDKGPMGTTTTGDDPFLATVPGPPHPMARAATLQGPVSFHGVGGGGDEFGGSQNQPPTPSGGAKSVPETSSMQAPSPPTPTPVGTPSAALASQLNAAPPPARGQRSPASSPTSPPSPSASEGRKKKKSSLAVATSSNAPGGDPSSHTPGSRKAKGKEKKKGKGGSSSMSSPQAGPAASPVAPMESPSSATPRSVGVSGRLGGEYAHRMRGAPLVSPPDDSPGAAEGYPDLGYLGGIGGSPPPAAAVLSPDPIQARSPGLLLSQGAVPESRVRSVSPLRMRGPATRHHTTFGTTPLSGSPLGGYPPSGYPNPGSPGGLYTPLGLSGAEAYPSTRGAGRPSVAGGPIGGSSHAPPPGMAEVFVVEWAPHLEPQMLEVQRGGAGVSACAVFHLDGVRNRVVPAESIVDVNVGGGMWVFVRTAEGETHKIRPRSAADFGLLVEAMGSLCTIGAQSAPPGRQIRAASIPRGESARSLSGGAASTPASLFRAGAILALILSVGYVFWGEVLSQFTTPTVQVRYITSDSKALDDTDDARAALRELFRGSGGGGGGGGGGGMRLASWLGGGHPDVALPCCRMRNESRGCALVILDCGDRKPCAYHAQTLESLRSDGVTKVIGVIGAAADQAESDVYLQEFGAVVALTVKQGALNMRSRAALNLLLEEKCPRPFAL